MKRKFLSAFLLLSCWSINQVVAQNQSKTIPLKDIYKDWLSRWDFRNVTCDTLYYTENIESYIVDSAIQKMRSIDTFKVHSLYRYSNSQPLVLTADERNYLITQLTLLKSFKWTAQLFPKSKVIKLTEVGDVLASTEKLKTEDERNMCSIVYTFSKPVFFRDSSYCLYLNQAYYRTNYTQLEFYFYKKDFGYWEKFSKVYARFEHKKEK